jgi:hypothetical protein
MSMMAEPFSKGNFQDGTEFELYKDDEDENIIWSIIKPIKACDFITLNFINSKSEE